MANELRHADTGLTLEKAEYEHIAAHILNNQATGDIVYASSATQLSRLAIGATGYFLSVAGGVPVWVPLSTQITATKLDDFTAPDNNTDLNASTSKHGLMMKYPDTSSGKYLKEDGTWAVPPGGSAVTTNVMIAASDATAMEKAYATASGGDVCTGTNDHTKINAVIAAASAGQTVDFSGGTFVPSASIVGKSGVSLKSRNGGIISLFALGAGDYAIEYIGTTGSNTNLASNCAVLDTHVHVAAGAEAAFAANDLVELHDTSVWDSNIINQKKGELIHVGSTASGLINFRAGSGGVVVAHAADSYATASTAGIRKVTPVKDFTIEGLRFVGDASTSTQFCIYVDYGENVRVRDINVTDVKGEAIHIRHTDTFKVSDCHFRRVNEDGFGYGIVMEYDCQNGIISDCSGDFCRHVVSIGGGTGNGIPRNITVINCGSSESYEAAFDCHDVGENIVFAHLNCVHGDYGVVNYAHSGQVHGCHIRAPYNAGIAVGQNTGSLRGMTVDNNFISHADLNGFAIYVNDSTGKTFVFGNTVFDCTNGISDAGSSMVAQCNMVNGTYTA